MQQLAVFRKSFEPLFQSFVSQKIRNSKKILHDAELGEILTYTEKMMQQGGKRVRPYLASLGYRFVKPRVPASTTKLCIALELFHAFALVHDDVMDRGTSRYGMRTIHLEVAEQLKRKKRRFDLDRTGDNQAILVGDLLFAWCHEVMSSAPAPARALFQQMIDEVILGQMIDVDCLTRSAISREVLARKMKYKTASYTIIKPLQIGVALAGGSSQLLKSIEKFGEALGIAFQIQDDLFDLTLPTESTQKTVLSDLTDGQHTIFTEYLLSKGTAKQKQELTQLMGKRFTEKDRPRILRLFSESRSLACGQQELERYLTQATRLATKLPIAVHAKKELLEFIAFLSARQR